MVDVRMPEWITSEEDQDCYREIMDIAKQIHASCVIAEDENTKYFLLEIEGSVIPTPVEDLLYDFNDGARPLLCDAVLECQNVRGERYVIF